MKDPAFLFYPGDWLGGTIGMTFEEKGAYLELLIYQFNKGKFTEKEAISIVGENLWKILAKSFKNYGPYFWNVRLKSETDKRKNYSNSRRLNALGRKKQDEHMQSISSAHGQHKENENRNENIVSKVSKNGVFVKPSIEILTTYIVERKGDKSEAEKFYDFYESKNWMVGKNKMKDWKASVRNWMRNNKPSSTEDYEQRAEKKRKELLEYLNRNK